MRVRREKNCGVLLPLSALPSAYGIGDMGQAAYDFVDFLAEAGQRYWQILPLGPTSYGDSPYQSPSAFAGNPYYIDLAALCADGLLTAEELAAAERPAGRIDYADLFYSRLSLLRAAFGRFYARPPADFADYCAENGAWLSSFALFTALKEKFSSAPHWQWPSAYRDPHAKEVQAFAKGHSEELDFVRFMQYTFEKQWLRLRAYANRKGVQIIGDMPIYVAYDSADFWEDPRRFLVNGEGTPTAVAGVPPDYFSADGQLWGNPLYDWQVAAENGYDWWIARIRRAFALYDVLRIDHFRAFSAFYAVPAGAENAKNGKWMAGPGRALFDALGRACGQLPIIAEDLGVDSPALRTLLRDCGFPGMKVMQFGFDGNRKQNAHAPERYGYRYVGYTGTHDNDTACGWFSSLPAPKKKAVCRRLPGRTSDIAQAMIRTLYASRVQTAIVPMQDWLRQGSEARINTPGTADGNWQYCLPHLPEKTLAAKMRRLAANCRRTPHDTP